MDYQDKVVDILCTVVNCGFQDVKEIVKMEEHFPGTTELALEFAEEYGVGLDFHFFVTAVQHKALEKLKQDRFSIPQYIIKSLYETTIDSNYMCWGNMARYESGISQEIQDAFASYLKTGNIEYVKKIEEFNYAANV